MFFFSFAVIIMLQVSVPYQQLIPLQLLILFLYICSVLIEMLINPLSQIWLGLEVISKQTFWFVFLIASSIWGGLYFSINILHDLHVASGERAGKRDHKRKVCPFLSPHYTLFSFFSFFSLSLFFFLSLMHLCCSYKKFSLVQTINLMKV